jgi:hypothetical protein
MTAHVLRFVGKSKPRALVSWEKQDGFFFYRKSVGFLDLGAHLPSGAQCSRTVLQGRAWWLWPSRHLDE